MSDVEPNWQEVVDDMHAVIAKHKIGEACRAPPAAERMIATDLTGMLITFMAVGKFASAWSRLQGAAEGVSDE